MTTSDMFLTSPLLPSPPFPLLFLLHLQFSTSQVFMAETTTTAALLSPAVGARPSCASAAARCAAARWCESRTHTSTSTASPAKVNKQKTKNRPHTDAHIQCCSVLHVLLLTFPHALDKCVSVLMIKSLLNHVPMATQPVPLYYYYNICFIFTQIYLFSPIRSFHG